MLNGIEFCDIEFATEGEHPVSENYDKLITESIIKEKFGSSFDTLSESGELNELRDLGILSESAYIEDIEDHDVNRTKRLAVFALAEEHKDPDLVDLIKANVFIKRKLNILSERYSAEAVDRIDRIKSELVNSKTVIGKQACK